MKAKNVTWSPLWLILVLCVLPGSAAGGTVKIGTLYTDVIQANNSFLNIVGYYNTTYTYNKTEVDSEINMCMANVTAESTYRQGNDTAILSETWTNVSLVNGSLQTEISDRQSADTTILSETWTNISNVNASLNTHTTDTGNPHTVTLAQLGAASSAQFTALDASLTAHNTSTSNPHSVTLAQVGAAASSHIHVDADIPNDITINYAAVAGDADTVDGSHASAFMLSSVEVRFTEWDGFTFGTEFVATSTGIAIITGKDSVSNNRYVRVTIDKDNAGTDIKTYTQYAYTATLEASITVPFDKGDGVTLSYSVDTVPIARVYYFGLS